MLFWNYNYIPSVEFSAKTECPRFQGEPVEILFKKSTPVFSSHANFSAKTECPRFHGEPVEILFQNINSALFVARKLFRQNRVPEIPRTACWNPNQPAPPRARSMARMRLLSTAEINASVLPSRISSLPLMSLPSIAIV